MATPHDSTARRDQRARRGQRDQDGQHSRRDRGPAGSRSSLRSANTVLVVEALRAAGPSSQAAVARATGLSPATVNSIVRALAEEGVVDIRPVNGRQSEVSLVTTEGLVLSLEIADGSIHGAAFSLADRTRTDLTSAASDPRSLNALVKDFLAAAPAGGDPVGIALAVQSPIDRGTGQIPAWVGERIPRWRGVRIGEDLPLPPDAVLVVDNDANLAALAEWTWGSGRGQEDYFYIKASEGVGGGLVVEGRVFHGGNGMAGVIGHMVVDPDGDVCYCGSRGCLTTKVSQAALVESLAAWHTDLTTLRDIVEGGERGDPACTLVLAEAGRHLGRAAAGAVRLVAPGAVTIGGILGASSVVQEAVRNSPEVANLAIVAPQTAFVPASIGQDAAILGGLAAVLDRLGVGMSELPDWVPATSV
ncbi:MAG: ROK family transcriptional regulator [Actinomyces dentalis]